MLQQMPSIASKFCLLPGKPMRNLIIGILLILHLHWRGTFAGVEWKQQFSTQVVLFYFPWFSIPIPHYGTFSRVKSDFCLISWQRKVTLVSVRMRESHRIQGDFWKTESHVLVTCLFKRKILLWNSVHQTTTEKQCIAVQLKHILDILGRWNVCRCQHTDR